MKKLLFTIIIVFAVLGGLIKAEAAPFLTCDAYENAVVEQTPTHFYLLFDNQSTQTSSPAVTGWGPANAPNLVTMKHDLSTLPDGNHTVKGKAAVLDANGGVIAESEWSETWSFSKAKPAPPSILSTREGTPPRYYLQSPPYANTVMGGPPSSFNVSMDGGAVVVVPATVTADGTLFKYDITNISTGTHVMNISAVNDWGTSATVAYTFQRYVVVVPKGVRIIK